MLIHGFHPVREALRHRPEGVVRVLVGERRGGGRRREIEGLAGKRGVEVAVVPMAELDRRTGEGEGVHNGFAAEVRGDAAAEGPARDDDLVVLAEDVQDPRNLGALMRVCEGSGVGRLMIRDRGSAPVSAVAVKASAGAAEWLPHERVTNSAQEIGRLKDAGFWVYGLAPGGDAPWEIDLTGKVAFVVGGEEKGMRRRTEGECDRLVGLPMRGRVASLNLATAAAAVLYEAVRQRGGREGGGDGS